MNMLVTHASVEHLFNTSSTSVETAAFTNRVDPDEVAHHEPPHQDLHYLLFSLFNSHLILNLIQLDKTIIKIFADVNSVVCFLALKELTVFSLKSPV